MKPALPLLTLLALLCLNTHAFQTLTDNEGRSIVARVTAFDGDSITIVRNDSQAFTLPLSQLSQADQAMIRKKYAHLAVKKETVTLTPGAVLTLHFPDLPPMADNQPSICEIHIPASYLPEQSFPLFVWFSGGKGSAKASNARGLVDFDKYVVVALPYPEGRLPRLGVRDGKIDEFWTYLKPMLEKVQETVPNISDKLRVAGGSSSGAHLIGSGICQKWRGFSDYFTAYVLHEGGYAPKKNYEAARRKPVLIIYGEKSTAYAWQQGFNETIKDSRAKLTFIAMPEDGHGLSGEGRKRIREWTDALLSN